jgi:hypothetical protein
MNVRINSGETKNPATAGFLLKSFGWFISTVPTSWSEQSFQFVTEQNIHR